MLTLPIGVGGGATGPHVVRMRRSIRIANPLVPAAERNRGPAFAITEFATDSPLEEDGFELLVRGRGESGCRAPGRSRSRTPVDLGKAEAERTADEAAQRPHQMLRLALAGLPGSCPNPGPRRRHARACPPRVCWPLCAWTIRATIRGARPYGLRCCHWDPRRNAHGVCQMLYRHGWSVTL